MFRKAAIAAVALVGASLTEAAKLQEISKRDGAHGHDHAHAAPAAPASAYVPPASSYSAPASSYGAPAASYGAPAPSYGAPAPSYEEPAPSYGAPSYGAPAYEVEEQPGFFPDVTFIIVGILIVIGLSLLFPTYVSLTTVRRKRDTAEGKIARLQSMWWDTSNQSNYGRLYPTYLVDWMTLSIIFATTSGPLGIPLTRHQLYLHDLFVTIVL